jgi:hypothetical protein
MFAVFGQSPAALEAGAGGRDFCGGRHEGGSAGTVRAWINGTCES